MYMHCTGRGVLFACRSRQRERQRHRHAPATARASMSSSCTRLFFLLLLHLHLLLLPACCSCCNQHLLNSSHQNHPPGVGGGNVTDGLKQYLARFGYTSRGRADADADADADARLLKLYQSTLGLPVTGRLDNITLHLLSTPRCGVPDLHAASRFAYFTGQPRWARQPNHFLLTYAITYDRQQLHLPPRKAVRAAFRRAFARWARVIPVRFLETMDYNTADVTVGFFLGDHGDGEPFDGPLGVLGHAFSPPSGQLHLDAAERWAVDMRDDGDPTAVDLESVATHEIGHVLGLAHSSSPEAVMYPSLKPRTRKVELTVDDVRGVQALYGSNPHFSLSSLSEPDTSSAARTTTPAPAIMLLLLATITARSYVPLCMLLIP